MANRKAEELVGEGSLSDKVKKARERKRKMLQKEIGQLPSGERRKLITAIGD